MNTWFKSIVAGLAVTAAYFFLYDSISGGSPKQLYQVHYILKVLKVAGSSAEMDDIINQTQPVLNRRITQLGYVASINRADLDKIDIVIKYVEDTLLTRQTIEENSKLEIREIYTLAQLADFLPDVSKATEKFFPKNPAASDQESKKLSNEKNFGSLIVFSVELDGKIAYTPAIGVVKKDDTALINKIFRDPEVLNSLPGDIIFHYGAAESSFKGKSNFLSLYAIRTKMQEAELQNRHIEYAAAEEGFNNQPQIILRFNNTGSRIWERITKDNIGRFLAIIIDQQIISAPRVNDAISGGNSVISGGFTIKEAELLARQLNAGYMPADLAIVKEDITAEKSSSTGKKLLITGIIFLLISGLAFLLFNNLKNR